MILPARLLAGYGFELLAAPALTASLRRNGVEAATVDAWAGGPSEPHQIVRLLRDGRVDLVVLSPGGGADVPHLRGIRRAAAERSVPVLTGLRAFAAAALGVDALRSAASPPEPVSLQEWHRASVPPNEGAHTPGRPAA
nr:hypothetical protein [Thermomonospora umbrina]